MKGELKQGMGQGSEEGLYFSDACSLSKFRCRWKEQEEGEAFKTQEQGEPTEAGQRRQDRQGPRALDSHACRALQEEVGRGVGDGPFC